MHFCFLVNLVTMAETEWTEMLSDVKKNCFVSTVSTLDFLLNTRDLAVKTMTKHEA